HLPYQADQSPQYTLGHAQQNAVLSVPSYANLDEYACLVTNQIGKSEPCWFQDQPVQGQIAPELSSWSFLGEDNLFFIAATAGIVVFLVVAYGVIVVVVCLLRHRPHSFKSFGTGYSGGSIGCTPQRFKLERLLPLGGHHLLDSSPDLD